MKTFFENLFVHFEFLTNHAGVWFKTTETERKKKSLKDAPYTSLSPECFNVRGNTSKKAGNNRRTPAP